MVAQIHVEGEMGADDNFQFPKAFSSVLERFIVAQDAESFSYDYFINYFAHMFHHMGREDIHLFQVVSEEQCRNLLIKLCTDFREDDVQELSSKASKGMQ